MYHLRISIITIVIICTSCGFIDLRPVEVTTIPDRPDTVLPEAFSPLSITFNTEMVRNEAENLIVIGSDTGKVEGDRFWNGDTLIFIPIAGWTAGTRYVLDISGVARSADGREIRLEKTIPFFAVNRNIPPCIVWHSPADGESVHADNPSITIHFSKPMNRITVDLALSAEGITHKNIIWSDNDDELTLMYDRILSPWTVYRWTLKDSALCADGVPLINTYSAEFSTDLDRLLPEVSRVYPVLQSQGRWIPTGGSLENGLGPGLSIAVEFNKPMPDAAFRSLRFEPSLSGRTERLNDTAMVFIPSRDPEPDIVYTLIVSGDAQDIQGLKIGRDYRRTFIPDIPWLHIVSINDDHNITDNLIMKIPAGGIDGDMVRFTIHFSQVFTIEAQQKTALAVLLNPFFPGSLNPIALRSVSWLSSDRLTMEWEKLEAGSPDKPHYYRMLFPGGRGGIENGSGIYLQQDIVLIMEVTE